MKELELEAKERKRRLSGTRSNPGTKEQVPQMFAEPAEHDDPQPRHPERRHIDTAPASAQPPTHTAGTKKSAKKDKAEGEAREKAA